MQHKILLLGSGELGKELVISLKRFGQTVVAVDSYAGAPAMQVADAFEVIDMLDGSALERVVKKHSPTIIVPEIEAIRTEKLLDFERLGIQVTPSARAVNFTMNRKAIRELAAKELALPTAKYFFATSESELVQAAASLGFPCVIKPLMSSSGKGQSVARTSEDLKACWKIAEEKGRGDIAEVIVEEFIPFEFEITLLTVTQKNGQTLFCAPIGHRQERGDYQESWQPIPMDRALLRQAEEMAKKVTEALTGAGIWGVEFFVCRDRVLFSELSPRPHDTGMVTLSGCQNFSEFELHARALLGMPIPEIELRGVGASAVILATEEGVANPSYRGINEALMIPRSDVRIFGKPITRQYRRMGVALAFDAAGTDVKSTTDRAIKIAQHVRVEK